MKKFGPWLAGTAAGLINGLFGAGGGMVLLPILSKTTDLKEQTVFANCVAIILPISAVSVIVYRLRGGGFLSDSVPYLLGGAVGGVVAGLILKKVKAKWLHRALGVFILWGAARLLFK